MRRRTRRGIVFLTALIGLTVMLLTGTAFMVHAAHQWRNARREYEAIRAQALADAGLHYLVWAQTLGPQEVRIPDEALTTCPVDDPRALTPGTVAAVFTEADLPIAGVGDEHVRIWLFKQSLPDPGHPFRYEVITQGEYSGYTRSIRCLLHHNDEGQGRENPMTPDLPEMFPPVFDYALFSRTNLMTSGWGYVDGAIGSNQNIEIKAQSAVTGNVYAHGQVDRKGHSTVGGAVVYGPELTYPSYDFDALRERALSGDAPTILSGSEVTPSAGGILPNLVNGTLYLAGGTYTFPESGVVFITGDLKVSSWTTLRGNGTLDVLGDTHLSAHLRSSELSSQDTGILLITRGDIKVSAHVTLDAFMYTEGDYCETAQTEINGAVIAGDVTLTAQGEVHYRRPSADIAPPATDDGTEDDGGDGSSLANWAMLSWEQLY